MIQREGFPVAALSPHPEKKRTSPVSTLNPQIDDVLLVPDPNWWRQAVVYQIYPRSFADGNGDGIGDLSGIISKIPYLKELGIDAVWLSPFYPSALADGGYDVDDYRDVDPRIGTLKQFREMVRDLHTAGIRLIVDIVPNHSSDQHVMFKEAISSPKGSPARERYIFRDGKGADRSQPPTDWRAMFGGSAWQAVGDGQFYLHTFAPEQPDWNWDHPDVRAEFLRTLEFWSDLGVDGFRIDVAHALAKDLSEPLPTQAELDAHPAEKGNSAIFDRDEVHDIYAEWRQLFERYDPPRTAVAEAWIPANRRVRYAMSDSLGQAFNFDLLRANFSAEEYREIIEENLGFAEEAGSSTTWVLSNHDVVRHATRYGLPFDKDTHERDRKWLLSGGSMPPEDRDLGAKRARAATLLMLALPGSAYLYQGEELGLFEAVDIPDDSRQDPTFVRSPGWDVGRDGCRVPIPWSESGPSFGFGTAGAHLPQPDWFGQHSVEVENSDPDSFLNLYRHALHLRSKLVGEEDLQWVSSPAGTLAFRRPGRWLCVTNFSASPIPLPSGDILLLSGELNDGKLPTATTAWIRG